jgi:hypothetical protein
MSLGEPEAHFLAELAAALGRHVTHES